MGVYVNSHIVGTLPHTGSRIPPRCVTTLVPVRVPLVILARKPPILHFISTALTAAQHIEQRVGLISSILTTDQFPVSTVPACPFHIYWSLPLLRVHFTSSYVNHMFTNT